MDKNTFLKELREELRDIPAAERESAVRYYKKMFDSAGRDGETELLQQLGSAHSAAAQIHLEGVPGGGASFFCKSPPKDTQSTSDAAPDGEYDEPARYQNLSGAANPTSAGSANAPEAPPAANASARSANAAWDKKNDVKRTSGCMVALIIIIVALPIMFTIGFPITITVFVVAISIIALLIGLLAAGMVVGFFALNYIGVSLPFGLMGLGAGLAMVGLFMLLFALIVGLIRLPFAMARSGKKSREVRS